MSLEFYNNTKISKSRKEHTCNLCLGEIKVGDAYRRESGKFDGEFFDSCLHVHCNNMIQRFVSENHCIEYTYDEIYDWLRDTYCHDCEYYEDCEMSLYKCEKIIKDFMID